MWRNLRIKTQQIEIGKRIRKALILENDKENGEIRLKMSI